MCGVVIYGFDQRKSSKMIGLSVELGREVGGRGAIADTDRVLDQPLVNCFCGMGHEDTTAEVRLGEDIGKTHCVVEVETRMVSVSKFDCLDYMDVGHI